MKLSTKGKYGLRAVIYIAENSERGYISVSEIAENLSLSDKYLEQLIRLLKKKDIIVSSRGAKGGYKLARDAADISVGEVLRTLEGELTSASCVNQPTNCDKEDCSAYKVFYILDQAMNKAMDSLSLKDIIEDDVEQIGEVDEKIRNERN